jgi:pimeloyl-ACP methyl ester carboxylesterase
MMTKPLSESATPTAPVRRPAFALPLALAVTMLAIAEPAAAAARTLGSLRFEPCTLQAPGMPGTVEAQCTTLEVPEDRGAADGRRIPLAVAWVPSSSPQARPDPVFMLAGGPGQSARESYPGVAGAFERVRRSRHVVLVDQRGTGGSNRLACLDAEGRNAFSETDDTTPEAAARFAEGCAATLSERADLRHYTTSDAVADLDAVRAAIGADTINLVGISYGTRVAQTYLRRFPQHVRTLVLDGVVPPDLVLGSEHAKNLEAALDRQFALCEATPECLERHGRPREALDRLRARLAEGPIPVRYRHPVSGEYEDGQLDAGALATVVRLFAYSPRTAALLPRTLARAAAGEPETLLAQARMIGELVGDQIVHGMQLSVVCAEDAPKLVVDPADADTVLGTAFVEFAKAQCGVWPAGRAPDDFFAPLASDKPVLLLSGEHDPVTPPRYGEQALAGYPNGRHLVARGTGHNVLPVGCVPRLLARFLDSADAKGLDAGCLDDLGDTPPFTGSYGPEP